MRLIKNILNPVICLAMGYACVHFYDAGNYDSVILCIVIFVLKSLVMKIIWKNMETLNVLGMWGGLNDKRSDFHR